ncbi:hypothetical protein FXE87_10850 [Vibrio mimicus]|nr:hypothetical protein FXF05_14145 [Vibrio mimicus]TXY26198.1 hypothetical protein FXE87_10850 [Vibrio mimicus]
MSLSWVVNHINKEHIEYAPSLTFSFHVLFNKKTSKYHPFGVTRCKLCKLILVQPENRFNSLIHLN